jgi:hypothetical protein
LTLFLESLSVSSLEAKPRINRGVSFSLAGRDVAAGTRKPSSVWVPPIRAMKARPDTKGKRYF